MAKEKKQRDILKLLYDENLEMERFKVYINQYIKESGRCNIPVSSKAYKQFNIPLTSVLNSVCGYLEELENIKNGKA